MKKILVVSFVALCALFLAPVAQAQAKKPCICTKEYRPVCGVNGKTYSNKCAANCAKVRVKCAGKCPCKRPCPLYKVAACPPGCKRTWTIKNGCKVPGKCKCKKPCPVFKIAACPKDCKRTWTVKNGCKVPGKCKCKKGVPCGLKVCKPGQKCVKVVCVKAPCYPICQ